MKKLAYVICAAILFFNQHSIAQTQTQNTGIVEKNFDVIPFHYLVIKGEVNVILKQGDKDSLRVKASTEGQNSIQIKQKGDKLTIRKKAFNFSEEKVFVFITVNRLDAIMLSQNAYVTCENQLKNDKIVVVAKDDSKIDLKTNASSVKTVFESKTNVNIKGNYVCHPAEDFHGGIESICVPLVPDSAETTDKTNDKLNNAKVKTYIKGK